MSEETFFKVSKIGNVGIITFDTKNSEINTLSLSAGDELAQHIDAMNAVKNIKAMVIDSAKRSTFIAGADINELQNASSHDEAKNISTLAQKLMDRIDYAIAPVDDVPIILFCNILLTLQLPYCGLVRLFDGPQGLIHEPFLLSVCQIGKLIVLQHMLERLWIQAKSRFCLGKINSIVDLTQSVLHLPGAK